ncbi:DNA alkylation repair protein, putative [Babesia ovata]|uniref:DNA alkylation repair protein, putative n=1 Tax=Babesia ovata TaxID=189622 RepID=A0A2H6KF72_9APIC|nr:DNA alkylation repair protein, putative [Babesia ovata]GBE61627.1 DNA alkylation repair protein, putative [Babesia ovata]
MSRLFVKQAPRLVRQHLPLVQTLSASAVVDALEDAVNLRHRDAYVDEFILRCESRALALLPDLRASGIVRSLFAFKRANVCTDTFANEVARFLLEECAPGRLYDGFLDCCTANDFLLLYKAFAM